MGIGQSFLWKNSRLHRKLDESNFYVSELLIIISWLRYAQQECYWCLGYSLCKIDFVGDFKGTLLKVPYLPVFLSWSHWRPCEYISMYNHILKFSPLLKGNKSRITLSVWLCRRISDIENGSSTLDFVKNMKNLTEL